MICVWNRPGQKTLRVQDPASKMIYMHRKRGRGSGSGNTSSGAPPAKRVCHLEDSPRAVHLPLSQEWIDLDNSALIAALFQACRDANRGKQSALEIVRK